MIFNVNHLLGYLVIDCIITWRIGIVSLDLSLSWKVIKMTEKGTKFTRKLRERSEYLMEVSGPTRTNQFLEDVEWFLNNCLGDALNG